VHPCVFAAVNRVAPRQPENGHTTACLRLGNGSVGGGGLFLSCNESDHGRVSPVVLSQRFLRARVKDCLIVLSTPSAINAAPI
jgi:hypothetical protein